MSDLSVNNKVLQYKGTSYQISQISTISVVELRIKNMNKTSLKSLKYTIPLGLIGIVGGMYIINNSYYDSSKNFGLAVFIIGLIFAIYAFSIIRKKIKESKNKYHSWYGIYLKMSNGDDPIFSSQDKS